MTTPRRNVLRMIAAAPFIAGGVKVAEEVLSPKERADFHYREFAKAMGELTEGFDGWNLYASERRGFEHLKPVSSRSFQSIRFGIDSSRENPIVIERHNPFRI